MSLRVENFSYLVGRVLKDMHQKKTEDRNPSSAASFGEFNQIVSSRKIQAAAFKIL